MTTKYKFNAKDFYEILDNQEERCFLSGRILTPDNTLAEHINPIRFGGISSKENICLVIEPLARLKRYYKEEGIVQIAADIIKNKGAKYGFKVTSSKKTKK
ncbi:hypothetical protein [Leptospira stimsonii]|uniref:HNH endonuclease n=1 Tax=Leptospira stimsonii TaxID=2202203 RepID=A0ABY2N9X9_9LEPT|nr:hypothetical protein [Leptospira stimsonii]TGK10698.1 hypothetical protein EHO98_22750 [Leptospira stimsonii]TGM18982.1 hypothetical protein EHQ90_05530 [Leptospira stimsonii]